jgi:glycosyltransferase involved in cell wall biosynthesis
MHFPARGDFYKHECKFLGTSCLTPRVSRDALEVGLILPIASYGGAEKVAYAFGRDLRERGARVHLFVVGKPVMKVLAEFEDVFTSINFLADDEFPTWGGPVSAFGQECYLPDSADLKVPDVLGFLSGLDFVVNCHSAPANSIMGALKKQKVKTATYLHVTDKTPLGRYVGHTYLTVSFEHAYDLILTCSRSLAHDLHALGIPSNKLLAVQNAGGFSVSDETSIAARTARAQPRQDRKLRVLYIGRLDRQKGVERLLGAVRTVLSTNSDVEFRLIGSSLLESDGTSWSDHFSALGITLEPPIYSSDALADAYSWADVLILPSRWEGAPLVIAECHQLGCIPIVTKVGACEELTDHMIDGLLVKSEEDGRTARAIADAITTVAKDDALRIRLATKGLDRAVRNQWRTNFAVVDNWLDRAFPGQFTADSKKL